MKTYHLLFIALIGYVVTGCTCPNPTKEKCTELYPCPETTTSACAACAAGAAITSITLEEAQTLINNAKSHITEYKSGVNVNPCQICLISQVSQGIFVSIGLLSDNVTPALVAKYFLATGDSAYANVTGSYPGGTLCPPGTKCN
ncbi:MAG: hypothetical protein ACHQNT_00065 [Bacteroidia bacterium]